METYKIFLIAIASILIIYSITLLVVDDSDNSDNSDKNRDCKGEWSGWDQCSKDCGGGTQNRTFTITKKAKGKGKCEATDGQIQTQNCNTQLCPIDCVGEWSGWDQCSKDCGGGTQNRTFTITKKAKGKGNCEATDGQIQTQSCNTQLCPIDCVGEWSGWDQCSKDCGGGSQNRTFTVTRKAEYDGKECKDIAGKIITTGASESQSCNNDIECCQKDQWYGRYVTDTGEYPIYPKTVSVDYDYQKNLDELQDDLFYLKQDMSDNNMTKLGCYGCTDCGVASVKKPCTLTSNTVCNDFCKPGKSYSHTGFEPCTTTDPCTKEGIDKVGTLRYDNICKKSCRNNDEDKWGIDSEYGPPCYDKCPKGQYSETGYGPNCFDCQICEDGKTKILCGDTKNTLCQSNKNIVPTKNKCINGYYFFNDKCYKCDDCSNEGSAIHTDCTATSNTICVSCGKNKFYGKRNTWVADLNNRDDMPKSNNTISIYSDMLSDTNAPEETGCLPCGECKFTGVEKECTDSTDTICNKPCVPGKTWSETGFSPCKPVKVDCSNYGLAVAASYMNDNICKKSCRNNDEDKWGIDSEYGPPCYDKCPEGQYSETGYGPNCFVCQTCKDSYEEHIKCGNTTNTLCKPSGQVSLKDNKCPEGYYKHTDSSCYKCDDCNGSAKYADCTPTSNTKCINCGENKWYGLGSEDPNVFYKTFLSDKKVNNENLTFFSNFTKDGVYYDDNINKFYDCHECTDCRSAGVSTKCSEFSDTVCNALCVPGKTWSETGFEPCKPVTKVDCGKKGLAKAASYLNDNICNEIKI